MRALRAGILGPGLVIGLLLVNGEHEVQVNVPFVVGVTLFVAGTLATFTRGFPLFSRWSMATIAVLDMFTLSLVFDLRAGMEVVDALIAVPAMWLGVALGRRGVLLAVGLSAVLFIGTGLALTGVPAGGWPHAIAIVAFAFFASAGIAASAEMWDAQMKRLADKQAQLERAMRVKDDFIALVSHELRTPLTSIMGYLDLAIDDADELPGALGAEIGGHLAAVSRNSDRLHMMVTDLLAAELAEREPMVLVKTPTDISALVRTSLEDFALRAEAAGVEITSYVEPDVISSADPTRILQAVDNLLSNGVKYTQPHGRVALTLRCRLNCFLLDVNDTGIGINADDQDGLFTKFFRARNATELAIPGIGLGLMITRIIIQAHGGTIVVHSREGVGTSVRVVIPIEPATLAGVDRELVHGDSKA